MSGESTPGEKSSLSSNQACARPSGKRLKCGCNKRSDGRMQVNVSKRMTSRNLSDLLAITREMID